MAQAGMVHYWDIYIHSCWIADIAFMDHYTRYKGRPMILTNNYGLPKILVKRIEESLYDNPYSDMQAQESEKFRTTELLDAPLIRTLWKEYKDTDKLVLDASEFVFIWMGITMHSMLEHESELQDNIKTEYKMQWSTSYNGKNIDVFGTCDYIERANNCMVIKDNKLSNVLSAMKRAKDSYVKQLNSYAFYFREMHTLHNIPFALSLRMFLRDHSVAKAMFDREYPQAAMVEVPVPDFGYGYQKTMLEQRIADHIDNPCRPCDKFERNFGSCAVMVDGYTRALKTYDNISEAHEHIQGLPDDVRAKASVEPRGNNIKCKCYCKVRSVCPYAKE